MTGARTNIAGVYKVSESRTVYDTGLDEKTVRVIMAKFEQSGKAFRRGEYIALPTWPKHQKWEIRSKIKLGIINALNALDREMILWLVHIGYRFDFSLTIWSDTLSIPSDTLSIPNTYDSNYSDSEFDSEFEFENKSDNADDFPDEPVEPIPASPPPKKTPKTKEASPEALALAYLIKTLHQAVDPKYSPPDRHVQAWAVDIDRLMNIDGRPRGDVEAMIRYAKTPGNFWFPNILSGKALRDQFPRLWAESQRPQTKAPRIRADISRGGSW